MTLQTFLDGTVAYQKCILDTKVIIKLITKVIIYITACAQRKSHVFEWLMSLPYRKTKNYGNRCLSDAPIACRLNKFSFIIASFEIPCIARVLIARLILDQPINHRIVHFTLNISLALHQRAKHFSFAPTSSLNDNTYKRSKRIKQKNLKPPAARNFHRLSRTKRRQSFTSAPRWNATWKQEAWIALS